jgi:hypothetical protein
MSRPVSSPVSSPVSAGGHGHRGAAPAAEPAGASP